MSAPMKIGFALLLASLLCLALLAALLYRAPTTFDAAPAARIADGASASPTNTQKFFRLEAQRNAKEILPNSADRERVIHKIFEDNLETLLGVRLVKGEHRFLGSDRSDTLGLDANNRPVIIEYKRDRADTIINQVMGYAASLESQQRDFELMVRDRLGDDAYFKIDWDAGVRVICVAANFNNSDLVLESKIDSLQLIRYQLLPGDEMRDEILTLQWVPNKAPDGILPAPSRDTKPPKRSKGEVSYKPMKKASGKQKARLDLLLSFFRSLTDGMEFKETKKYCKVMHEPNNWFATFVLANSKEKIAILVLLDLNQAEVIEGFPEDVSRITPAGKDLGGGRKANYRINILSDEDLESAKPLLHRAYEEGKR